MATPTTTKRPAGRPKVMDNPARLWLRVDEDVKRRATEKATEEGQDLTTALRELVAAYADGRVTIRRGRR